MEEGIPVDINDFTATDFVTDAVDISWRMNHIPQSNEYVTGRYFVKTYLRTKTFEYLRGTWTITAKSDLSVVAMVTNRSWSDIKTAISITSPGDLFFQNNRCPFYVDGFFSWSDSSGQKINFQQERKHFNATNLPVEFSYYINTLDLLSRGRKIEREEIFTFECHLICRKLRPVPTQKKQGNVPSTLSSDLKELFSSGKLSDFKLIVGDEEFFVHKAILAARSRVFAAMFQSNMTESRKSEVKISDIEPTVIRDLIEYMYTGCIPGMSEDKALSLYSASDKYSLEALKGRCVEFMTASLSVENVCVISTLADYHMDIVLKTAVNAFMRQHASEVVQSKRWKMFVKSKPFLASEILESVVLQEQPCERSLQSDINAFEILGGAMSRQLKIVSLPGDKYRIE